MLQVDYNNKAGKNNNNLKVKFKATEKKIITALQGLQREKS